MILHMPRHPPVIYAKVGAPKGAKTHHFFWLYLSNKELKRYYSCHFNWQHYQYLLTRIKSLFYVVYRKNSHSWYCVKNDTKELIFDIKHFTSANEIINYLIKEI